MRHVQSTKTNHSREGQHDRQNLFVHSRRNRRHRNRVWSDRRTDLGSRHRGDGRHGRLVADPVQYGRRRAFQRVRQLIHE